MGYVLDMFGYECLILFGYDVSLWEVPWGPRGPTRGPAPGICWRLGRWHRHACAWVYPGGPQRPMGHPGGSPRSTPFLWGKSQ